MGVKNYLWKVTKRAFNRVPTRNSNVSSRVQCPTYEEDIFREVKTFCVFIGYPRSGHSIVGSLIDAHPDAVLSHELDALKYLMEGFDRRQIFSMILRRSEEFAGKRRTDVSHAYFVPNQWQGRFRKLLVIGDKKGAGSSLKINKDSELLDTLQRVVGGSIKFIHVIRNPYDTISTMSIRNGRELEFSVRRFFMLCRAVKKVKERVDASKILDVRHESLIADPSGVLMKICLFLGLEPFDDYLRDCASIVYKSPHKSRSKVLWPDELIASVKEHMTGFSHFEGYSFEE